MTCTAMNPFAGSYWRRDLNSSWCANPSPIHCCMSGSSFWSVAAALKPGSVNGGLANAMSSTPIGLLVYHNAFATSHTVEDANVVEVVAAGRSRWKIENENNNTLKTKGYHFEHNYGHGQQFLSSLLATLILLAYGLHTLLEWMDDKYQLLRQKLPSRQRLFNDIRALTTYLCFDSWDALLVFMLSGFSHPPPKPKTG